MAIPKSESLAGQARTSSTPAVALTHTVSSPTAGQKRIIFFSCQISASNTGTRNKVDFYVDGSLVCTRSPRVNATQEQHDILWAEDVTGKSANFDCKIEWSSTNNSNSVTITNARIVEWRYDHIAGLDLQYAKNSTNNAITASFVAQVSKSFTPSSTGNYFVIGGIGVSPGSASVTTVANLTVDGTSYPLLTNTNVYLGREAPAVVTDAFIDFVTGIRQSLTTGASRTISMDVRNVSGTLGTNQYSFVLAFREDAFAESYYGSADTATADTTTSTTYERRLRVSPTPAASTDYLVLAGTAVGGQSGDTLENERTQAHILIGATELILHDDLPKQVGSNTDYLSCVAATVHTAAATFNVDIEYRMQVVTDNTSRNKNSWIVVLAEVPAVVTRTGTGAITLGAVTVEGTGRAPFVGTSAITLGALTVAGTGRAPFIGTAAISLPVLTVAATGKESFKATGAATLSAVTVDGTGKEAFKATGAATLASLTVSGTGRAPFVGTSAIALTAVAVAGTGKETFTATGAATLSALTVDGAGKESFKATGAPVLSALTVAGEGAHTEAGGDNVTATGAIVLTPVTVSGTVVVRYTGTGAIVLTPLAVSGTGKVGYTATAGITLAAATVAGTGTGAAAVIAAARHEGFRRNVGRLMR